jgi:uncharacterized protein YcbX
LIEVAMTVDQSIVGTVVSLWRYPVKSMQGEELNASAVTDRGLLGDRALALVDAGDGKVASAKNPRKWPHLFDSRAAFTGPVEPGALPAVRITLPDGRALSGEQADRDQVLSAALGRPVALRGSAAQAPVLEEYWPDIDGLPHRDAVTDEAMPQGAFFDLATVHLLTTATLDRLRELYPQGRFEARRFRPNIIVACGDQHGPVEQSWVGRTLALGDEVRLQITRPCGRCVMTTLAQADLPRDTGILRAAVQHTAGNVGVYASVLRGGTLRRGDAVRLV